MGIDLFSLLLLALVNALFIVGVYRAYSYTNGMIFGKIRFNLEKHLPESIQKPLFACVWCMASVYSFIIFWPAILSYQDFTLKLIFVYLLYIPVVSTLSGYINDKLIEG